MSNEMKAELLELGKQVAISLGLFFIGVMLGENLSQAIIIACIPYGWKVLNRITPNVFLWMPFVGWLIYFIVKAVLAAMIGIFVLPYTLIKCIVRVVRAYKNQG